MLSVRREVFAGIRHEGIPTLPSAEVVRLPFVFGIRDRRQADDEHSADRILERSFILGVFHGSVLSLGSVRWFQLVGSRPMSKRLSDAKWYGGTTRLVGAGTFLKTRPAKSNLDPWQGQ